MLSFLHLLPILLKTHQHIVWNNISRYVIFTSLLWPNIHAMAPNCSGLFLMYPFLDTYQSGFSESKWQSCILFPEYFSWHTLGLVTRILFSKLLYSVAISFLTSKFCVPLLSASAYISCGNCLFFRYLQLSLYFFLYWIALHYCNRKLCSPLCIRVTPMVLLFLVLFLFS